MLNLLQAVLGTAVLRSALSAFPRVHTALAAVVKEDCFSAAIAFASGYLVARRWRVAASRWVWTAGICWLLVRAAPELADPGALWATISGCGCSRGLQDPSCGGWLLFTVPAIRIVFYSVGGLASTVPRGAGGSRHG